MLYRALNRGVVIRPEACERCGKTAEENGEALCGHHHNGYDEVHALDVVWLCRSCHMKIHNDSEWGRRNGRRSMAKLTSEQRSAKARAAALSQSPEQLGEDGRRGVAAYMARTTPAERSERSRRVWATRRARYGITGIGKAPGRSTEGLS